MEAAFCIPLDSISFWVTDKMTSASCRYCHLSQPQQPELLPLISRLEWRRPQLGGSMSQFWPSWIYRIIVFIKSEIFRPLFLQIFLQKIFHSSCPLPITRKLDHLMLFHRSCSYVFVFFVFSVFHFW